MRRLKIQDLGPSEGSHRVNTENWCRKIANWWFKKWKHTSEVGNWREKGVAQYLRIKKYRIVSWTCGSDERGKWFKAWDDKL